ncbi:hypothetical protein K474DRAFT_1693360 [Panus rudis PR-1116 ss-1]|nr:hypothetical protein K474DRAFT_1693360 [Panus rudis PR-1116 ss-1]
MAQATTSRRLARGRNATLDAIEDAGSSQVPTQDSVQEGSGSEAEENDDANPRPSGRAALKVKKEKGVKKESRVETPEEILARIGDQPIDKGQTTRIAGIASDWAQIRVNIHANSYSLIKDVAGSLAEFAEGEQGQQSLEDLENTMKRLIDTENELKMHEDALVELQTKVASGEDVSDAILRYEEAYAKRELAYKKKTTRQKYAKHSQYAEFRQAIHDVLNPDTPMPPVTDFIPKEPGDDSDEDEDIEVGGVTQDFKCPLTLMFLENPLTSQVCGHSFSAAAIRDYLGNKRSTKCPASGCNKHFSWADLKPNKELAKKARDAARRERARESSNESSADEVIE